MPLTYNCVQGSNSQDQNANKFITMETEVVLNFEERKLRLSTPSHGQSFNEDAAFSSFRYIIVRGNISACIDRCSTAEQFVKVYILEKYVVSPSLITPITVEVISLKTAI